MDLALVPWLKELNSIEGIVTIQSCCGHKNGNYIDDGHLWIRLSKDKYYQLIEQVDKLINYKERNIYVKLYFANFRGRYDLIEIFFDGLGVYESIQPIMEHIIKFFSNI